MAVLIMFRMFITSLFMVSALSVSTQAKLLLNEVMSNEPGSNVSLEWLEIWNFSDTTASIDGIIFADGDKSTDLSSLGDVGAGEFVVLARNVVEFELYFGDASGEWGDDSSENYSLLSASMSLRNDKDSIAIVDSAGVVMSYCKWSSQSPDGISFERTDPRFEDAAISWLQSIAPAGSTPGRRNSVTPGDNDLLLRLDAVVTGDLRDLLQVSVTVENVGLGTSEPNLFTAGLDLNHDGVLDSEELFAETYVDPLQPFDSITIQAQQILMSGRYILIAGLQDDDNPSDNDTTLTVRFGLDPSEIVINEFLANPESQLESEWIELLNISDENLDLSGWRLCDAVSCAELPDIQIGAGEFLILAQDELSFNAFYYYVGGQVLEVDGWQQLNNGGDTIFLVDQSGLMIDSVIYLKTNDDNVSLERIDPGNAGFELSNWYRSTAALGSTPGEPNSVLGGFDTESAFSLDRKIISPDGDGIDDLIAISYRLPRESVVTLRVFDLVGRVVRTIFDGAYLVSGEYVFDGMDDNNAPLDIGMYIMLAEVSGDTESTHRLVFAVAGRK
jgi:hypothetical protein